MPFCVIPKCGLNDKKKEAEGVSFHCFPKREDLKRKWVSAVLNENIDPSDSIKINLKGARVCSRHFQKCDYSISCSGQRRRLLPNANPSAKTVPDSPSQLVSSHFIQCSEAPSDIINDSSTKSPFLKKAKINTSPLNVRNVPLSPIDTASPLNVRKVPFSRINISNNVTNNDKENSPILKVSKRLFISHSKICPSKDLDQLSLNITLPTVDTQTEITGNLEHKDASTQTSTIQEKLPSEDKSTQACAIIRYGKPFVNTRKQRRAIYNLNKKVEKLTKKLQDLSEKSKKIEMDKKDPANIQFKKVKEAALENDLRGSFLLEQVLAFEKEKLPYSESTVKICCLLYKKSPAAYTFLREIGILHLPHRVTLKRFIGHASGEDGVTGLIVNRLKAEFSKITNEHEKLGSLVMDEMAIQSKLIYDRNLDSFFGKTSEALNREDEVLATHLLCFVFQGLSTNFRLPVAYFYTANLTGEQLYMLTKDVIKVIESTGFAVLRLVADNAKTNTSAFTKFGNGTLTHEVQHPNDPERKLFIAFDQSHLIKNLRNQFLAREFHFIGLLINSDFIRWLYNIQKGNLIKPVRFLTRKVVFPTPFEKMNVLRAVQIFSEPLTAALRTVLNLHLCDKEVIVLF